MKKKFEDFVDVVSKLRSPEGCPWDRKQTVPDYKKFLIEEAYELVEAIDADDPELIKEELGDVLLLVVMIAQIAKEQGDFDINDVVDAIAEKMIFRHPHVFGDKSVKDAEEVLKNWMEQKSIDKQRKTLMERLPKQAPALLKSRILFKEMKHTGHENKIAFDEKVANLFIDAAELSDKQIVESVFHLSYLAYKRSIDIEETLRQRVLDEANKHKYNLSD